MVANKKYRRSFINLPRSRLLTTKYTGQKARKHILFHTISIARYKLQSTFHIALNETISYVVAQNLKHPFQKIVQKLIVNALNAN